MLREFFWHTYYESKEKNKITNKNQFEQRSETIIQVYTVLSLYEELKIFIKKFLIFNNK